MQPGDRGVGRFVFGSSCSVYGETLRCIPRRAEATALKPFSPYAATKRSRGAPLAVGGADLSAFQTASLRFFTVYGPRQRPDLAYFHALHEG